MSIFRHNLERTQNDFFVMRTEKELISQIRQLRNIKPSPDWVVLTKSQILGENTNQPRVLISFLNFLFSRPVYAGLFALLVIAGVFGFSRNSLPGDPLYLIRRVAHKGEAVFVSKQEKPIFQLKLANERLKDLANASVRNLVPTISEFQANVSEAARTLSVIDASTSDPIVMKKIVNETRKLEENKQKAESLGVVIGEEGTTELNEALAKVTENLIKDLESRTLSEEKENILSEMKGLFEQGNYSSVLELYLTNQ